MINKALTAIILLSISSFLWAQSTAQGVWNFAMNSPMGAVDAKVVMHVDGAILTGEFDLGGGRKWPIEEGTIEGSDIAFSINRDGASMTYLMSARVEGNSITGTASAMGTTVDWSMTRE